MRYLTCFTPDRHRIDIKNSILGGEKIYYDGELVSTHTSILGGVHEFKAIEQGESVIYSIHIDIKWPLRIGFDIYRNGAALLLS